jgi:hypothetical protein
MKGKDFLPCPFCGATPHVVTSKAQRVFRQDNEPSYGYGHYVMVQHQLVKCPTGCAQLPVTKWNSRWPKDPLPKKVEATE